jgi:hypothetical protein
VFTLRHFSPPLLAALVLLAAPFATAGQDFPPPEQASKLHQGEEPPAVGPILAAGIGWGSVTSLGDGKNFDPAALFKAGKSFHGLAGIRLQSFGLAGLYQQGTPGVETKACPDGGCSATSTRKGVLAMLVMGGASLGPLITLGIGGTGDRVEIKQGGGLLRRLEGWSFVERMSVEVPVGPPTSRFRLGGYFMLEISNYTKQVTPGGTTNLPSTADSPLWGELGISASFF